MILARRSFLKNIGPSDRRACDCARVKLDAGEGVGSRIRGHDSHIDDV
jgi:hypothetical protein